MSAARRGAIDANPGPPDVIPGGLRVLKPASARLSIGEIVGA